MRRNGTYAIYKDKEYEVSRIDAVRYKLRSYDIESQDEGFNHHFSGCFLKIVSAIEIQSAYDTMYYARYKALEFPVFQEESDKLLLGSGTHGPDIIKEYCFIEVDRFDYEKWVEKSDVEKFYEVKVPMWGFPAP